jgi:hypothetical protein
MTGWLVQALLVVSAVVLVSSKGHRDPVREATPNASCSNCCLQGQIGAAMGELHHVVRLMVKEEVEEICPSRVMCSNSSTDSISPSPTAATSTVTVTVTQCPSFVFSTSSVSLPSPMPYLLGDSKDNPASCCRDILDCNPNAESKFYWIRTGIQTVYVYCHMEEDKCGVRGVMRVANIDMTDPGETCPSSLTLNSANGKRICGPSKKYGCSSVRFHTFGCQFSHVCVAELSATPIIILVDST